MGQAADMSTTGVKSRIDKLIRSNKVVVFSKPGCPYCLGSRNIIRKYIGKLLSQDDVVFYDIEAENDCRETQNYLKLITGAPTVPNVFVGGRFVGGLDKLKILHKTGELERQLREK